MRYRTIFILLCLPNLLITNFRPLTLLADEAMEDCGFLRFTDDTMKATFLQALSTMRKHRLFCDVVLNVRAVVVDLVLDDVVLCRRSVVMVYLYIVLWLWLSSRLVAVVVVAAHEAMRSHIHIRHKLNVCGSPHIHAVVTINAHHPPPKPLLYPPSIWHRSRTPTFTRTKTCSPACRPI